VQAASPVTGSRMSPLLCTRFGTQVSDFGNQVSGFGFRFRDSDFRIRVQGIEDSDFEYHVQIMKPGFRGSWVRGKWLGFTVSGSVFARVRFFQGSGLET